MSFYVQRGQIPPKRHTQFQRPDGALYTEEVLGEEGFHGIGSIAYHIHPPTLVEAVGEPEDVAVEYAEEAFLAHRHFLGPRVEPGGDWLTGRVPIMGNADIVMSMCVPTDAMPQDTFYKNATHDELVYVHDGEGTLHTVLGDVEFRQGDYVHVPADAHPPLAVRVGRPAAPAGDGVADRVPAAQALPQRHGPTLGALAVLRARLPPAGRAAGHRPGRAVYGQDQEAREAVPVRLPLPPVRRRGLGRLHVPDGLLDPRLRADHRADPPAAAGAPDVRGGAGSSCARSCRGCSTTTRTRSRRRTTTRTSTRTRSCITPRATSCRARGSAEAASRSTPAASRTARTPARPRPASAHERRTSWR